MKNISIIRSERQKFRFRQSLKKYLMNLEKIRVLMPNELTGSQKRYYTVDTTKTLQEFLLGKTVVEYPTFIVTLESFLDRYKLILEDEQNKMGQVMRERRLNHFVQFNQSKGMGETQIAN